MHGETLKLVKRQFIYYVCWLT